MAFDGITIAALTSELNRRLCGAHIRKIAQPESDELILSFRTISENDENTKKRDTLRLKLSANASLPLFYLTEENKPSPLQAPNFCMLLRKHLSGAKVTEICQEGMERVLRICFSNRNELGDEIFPSLIVEIMGKHSNILFLDEKDTIIDSIKHVNGLMSSVREVLPGRPYFIPNTRDKLNPLSITTDDWNETIFTKHESVAKALSGSLTGISMLMAHELAYRAGIDGDSPIVSLNGNERSRLMTEYRAVFENNKPVFSPVIYYDRDIPKEFAAIPLSMYESLPHISDPSISVIVERFYKERELKTRIKSKSADLTATVQTHIERCSKKLTIFEKQIQDTKKKDKYKIYGELITTYGYTMDNSDSSDVLHCIDHYNDCEVEIPYNPELSVSENANRYFEKYNKCKRTYEAVTEQAKETAEELNHLKSVLNELQIARTEEDLVLIRLELQESGYIRHSGNKKNRNLPKSQPLHFISSDGYDIYVGKNNYQNEEITFKLATGNDWWFHAKQAPGSHVVLKTPDKEPPVTSFEEAAGLAAWFSSGRGADKLEIDYIQKKHVKKPKGGKPGFVVYYTNYSMIASCEHRKRVRGATREDEQFL